jgi:hypothetical protein
MRVELVERCQEGVGHGRGGRYVAEERDQGGVVLGQRGAELFGDRVSGFEIQRVIVAQGHLHVPTTQLVEQFVEGHRPNTSTRLVARTRGSPEMSQQRLSSLGASPTRYRGSSRTAPKVASTYSSGTT